MIFISSYLIVQWRHRR